MMIWLAAIVGVILAIWGVLAIVTHVVYRRFRREWETAAPGVRRKMQLAAYRVHAGGTR